MATVTTIAHFFSGSVAKICVDLCRLYCKNLCWGVTPGILGSIAKLKFANLF
jgi:hypothetical protein